MEEKPSIFDILKWREEGTEGAGEYLISLLETAGQFPEDIDYVQHKREWVPGQHGTPGDWGRVQPQVSGGHEDTLRTGKVGIGDILSQLFTKDIPFQDMTREDLEKFLIEGLIDVPGGGEMLEPGFQSGLTIGEYLGGNIPDDAISMPEWMEPEYGTGISDWVNSLLSLQKGYGQTGSILDKFRLPQRLDKEETKVERVAKTSLDDFITSRFDRYGQLQGGSSTEAELAKIKHLANLSDSHRKKGRAVKGVYDELSDELFGGYGKWLGYST